MAGVEVEETWSGQMEAVEADRVQVGLREGLVEAHGGSLEET